MHILSDETVRPPLTSRCRASGPHAALRIQGHTRASVQPSTSEQFQLGEFNLESHEEAWLLAWIQRQLTYCILWKRPRPHGACDTRFYQAQSALKFPFALNTCITNICHTKSHPKNLISEREPLRSLLNPSRVVPNTHYYSEACTSHLAAAGSDRCKLKTCYLCMPQAGQQCKASGCKTPGFSGCGVQRSLTWDLHGFARKYLLRGWTARARNAVISE